MDMYTVVLCIIGILLPLCCFGLAWAMTESNKRAEKRIYEACRELECRAERLEQITDECKKCIRVEVSDSVLEYMKKGENNDGKNNN